MVQDLVAERRLSAGQAVADVGSGTGLLSRLFLSAGCRVFGVEPNREMRLAGEAELAGSPGFTSIDGTAEATTLLPDSVNWVVAGQAFHWFNRDLARQEFGTYYGKVNHRNLQPDVFDRFFGAGNYEERSYPNNQRLDYPGLEGRLLSSSYTPAPDHPARSGMMERLRQLFQETEKDGLVEILYRTRVWVGTLNA